MTNTRRWTGLLDKNNNKIYENSTVKFVELISYFKNGRALTKRVNREEQVTFKNGSYWVGEYQLYCLTVQPIGSSSNLDTYICEVLNQ